MLLGFSLLAITILAALYATPWQAATIFAVITGIAMSVSIYFGGCANCENTRRTMQAVRDSAANEIRSVEEEAARQVQAARETLRKREREIEHDRAMLQGLLEGILCRKAQIEAAQREAAQREAAKSQPVEVIVIREIIIIDDRRSR